MSGLEVIGPRRGASPLTVVLSELGTVDIQSAYAAFDGSGAAGAFLAALTIRAQDGSILVRVFPSQQLGAGDTADVTFGPFLGSAGGGAASATAQEIFTFDYLGQRLVQNGVTRWYAPFDATISEIQVNVGAAPTGSGLTVRVKKNGASIGTVTLAASTFVASFVPSDTTVTAGDYYSVDVTAVGSTYPGADLVTLAVGVLA